MNITEEIQKVERKINDLRLKLMVEEKVLERLKAIQNPHPVSVKSRGRRKHRTKHRNGSLSSKIEALLKEVGRPMQVKEIKIALEGRGVKTDSKYGLGPMIASAVRKSDVFVKLRRGLYYLKKQANKFQEPLLK